MSKKIFSTKKRKGNILEDNAPIIVTWVPRTLGKTLPDGKTSLDCTLPVIHRLYVI